MADLLVPRVIEWVGECRCSDLLYLALSHCMSAVFDCANTGREAGSPRCLYDKPLVKEKSPKYLDIPGTNIPRCLELS